jgi:hypothetical protein
VPMNALWEVANYLELAPEIDYAAPDYDPAAERPALVDELLQWGAEQKERRLALASKLEWEPYKHVEDLSTLTDMQEAERVACERCGFIFKMYHADSWWCEIADMMRKLVLTGVMVFVARDSSVQIAVGCLVNFAVLLGNVGLRPMADAVVRSPAFQPFGGSRASFSRVARPQTWEIGSATLTAKRHEEQVDQANNIALLELYLALFLGLLFRVNVVSDSAAEGALFEAVAALLGMFIFVYPVVRRPGPSAHSVFAANLYRLTAPRCRGCAHRLRLDCLRRWRCSSSTARRATSKRA